MTTRTLVPHPPGPPPQEPPEQRKYARTRATRLLSAGTYLDPGYRRAVIRELLTQRFRVVAPSYGYDAVSVLAHALAARRLHRIQWASAAGTMAVIQLLIGNGVLSPSFGFIMLCWAPWAAAYMRRLVTLHILMTRLRETGPDGGFDGACPSHAKLTAELAHKIDREQAGREGLVFYGGFRPFVGAGRPLRNWSNAQLLLGAPKTRIMARKSEDGSPPDLDTIERRQVVPFTVDEITGEVAARMAADLRDETRHDERIDGLTVERRRYTTAIRTDDRSKGDGWSELPSVDDLPDIHWREDYDAAREYLCVRVGSWNEELVTSIFVGFDIKGNTLHTEFYTYTLRPLVEDFHLVDALPASVDRRLAVRVAWDMFTALGRWGTMLCLLPLLLIPERFLPAWAVRWTRPWRATRARRETAEVLLADEVTDTSEFRLGRYVNRWLNCGALASIRELATSETYHHFFQEADAKKYMKIVERRLLKNVRAFLDEHDVDLVEHDRAQTNILLGDNSQNVFGGQNSGFGYNYQPSGAGSSGEAGK
ncbi:MULTISPECIES: hypothetical protein [unclassified Streptomyces]|uniref:hypothetical protein n=1 Tax=unclassified Streptomyces TaxID=2593676 RepID=UPI001F049870|nr:MULTISPECIES: hypothetical protein [unclassified Streptomyces]MCH0562101.1 hypothetical protein [Streptomyces sp. MUM 2J]MCH0568106.1 hypothetical protein [Streptomyces sp. MUM 136J]